VTATATAPAELSDGERYRFEADGFLVVPGALPPEHAARARAELETVAASAAAYDGAAQDGIVSGAGQLRSVTDPLSACPPVLDVILHPGFFPKVHALLHGTTTLLSNEYFVTPGGSSPRLSWHRDAEERNYPTLDLGSSLVTINCLVLLSDVAVENGPTIAIPGSHRWGRDRPVPTGWPGAPDPAALPGHVKLTGKAGTAVFFDSRLCHAQSANRSGDERHALVLVLAQRWMRSFDGIVPSAHRAS
jgi:ectoine hydroxylase-related dioxygenase (phytanoyl-CoA dioxygenase family)